MGAGKSTVGPLLAEKLGWNFIDTDLAIEAHTKKTVSELFRLEGEEYFREIETEVILELASRTHQVVALGGGSLMKPENFEVLNTSGLLVYLKADLQTLETRIKSSLEERPLFIGLDSDLIKKKIASLMKLRQSIYNQCPIRIETDAITPIEIAHNLTQTFVKVHDFKFS
jgi:shikimate kinase